MPRVRYPAVAGAFYESDSRSLRRRLEWCFKHGLGPGRLPASEPTAGEPPLGLVSPHAGYMYSGPVAAHGYYELSLRDAPDVVVIVGPNHHGLGAPVALSTHDAWRTPLGDVRVDRDFVSALTRRGVAELDDAAHMYEHSIEVQLPFLQYAYGERASQLRIVPIAMLLQNPDVSEELGRAIHEVSEELGARPLVIASTDLTHYEPQGSAQEKDRAAIDAILRMDPRRLYDVVVERDITMCGVGPVMTLIAYANSVGAAKATLLKYATSGDVTGDYSSVVGYASVLVTRG